jgi:hypothetical protein
MKKEWCGNFDSGQCKVEGPVIPSLAQLETEDVSIEPEKIEFTDRNSILNYLLMNHKYKKGMVIPEKITMLIPKTKSVTVLKCTASNSRSAQRPCSHFCKRT